MIDSIWGYNISSVCPIIINLYLTIVLRLEFWGVKLIEPELLKKIFSTIHASNIVVQQQN